MTGRISIPALRKAAKEQYDQYGPTLLALVEAVEALDNCLSWIENYPLNNKPYHWDDWVTLARDGRDALARFDFGEDA